MSIFSIFRILVLLLFIHTRFSFSNEYVNESYEEKVYVKANELWIDDNGMFVNYKNIAMPISAVFSDTGGLFFSLKHEASQQKKCPNGHVSVVHWGGCAMPTCLYYAYGGIGE